MQRTILDLLSDTRQKLYNHTLVDDTCITMPAAEIKAGIQDIKKYFHARVPSAEAHADILDAIEAFSLKISDIETVIADKVKFH